MIPITVFAGKHVAVFGLGRSGCAAGHALMAGGAIVHAWDDSEKSRNEAEIDGLTVDDLYAADWALFSALVLTPGVPLTHPEPHKIVQRARAANVEIIGDVELFAREINSQDEDKQKPQIVAITGTNGKSTTAALVGHILERCGRSAHVVGNIGQSILSAPPPDDRSVYVIELSSYQLDLTFSLRADVAILLNITPDHLDRHGGMEGYVNAKSRIFMAQEAGDLAVVGVDDGYSQEICTRISSEHKQDVCPISVGKVLGHGIYVIDGILYDGMTRPTSELVNLRMADALPGRHNWQNTAAAYAATRKLMHHQMDVANAILSFGGLSHRLEKVKEIEDIPFINDSKATNAEAAANALAAFENIFWIVGGKAKDDDFEALSPHTNRVKKAYVFGESQAALCAYLSDKVEVVPAGDLRQALEGAARDARAEKQKMTNEEDDGQGGPIVLFSPACASFDLYRDFEERGEHFRSLVEGMSEHESHSDVPRAEASSC